jgi:hypothetical protein
MLGTDSNGNGGNNSNGYGYGGNSSYGYGNNNSDGKMHLHAFMYFRNYMVDNHVILETSFTDIFQSCNFGITWYSTM